MSNIVALQLEDGSRILVETDPAPMAADERESGRPDLPRTKVSLEIPQARFKQAVDVLTKAAHELFEGVRGMPQPPETYEVSFGVKLTAELDAVLAKSSGEANFSVKLTWTKPDGPEK